MMNETNYRRLRADLVGLLATPERFHHYNGFALTMDAPCCVACRCAILEGTTKFIVGHIDSIRCFLGIPEEDAGRLYLPRPEMQKGTPNHEEWSGEPFLRDAIAHLDEIAARHGLEPLAADGVPDTVREQAFLARLQEDVLLPV
jgi:hypothetical protein